MIIKDSSYRPCVWGTVYEGGGETSVLVPVKYLDEFNILSAKRKGGKLSKYEYDQWMRTVDERYPIGTFIERWGMRGLLVMAVLLVIQASAVVQYIKYRTEQYKNTQASNTAPASTISTEQKKQDDLKKKEQERAAQAAKEVKAHQKDSAQKAFFKTYKKKYYCKYTKAKKQDVCRCKSSPMTTRENAVFVYFIKSGQDVSFRFTIQFEGNGKVFDSDREFLIDDKKYEYEPLGDLETENKFQWQRIDENAKDALPILDLLRKAKKATIRHHRGMQYYDNRSMSKQELTNIKTMMDVYDLFER